MKLYDFSKRFSRAAEAWMRKKSGKYKPEEMEERIPDLYIRWLDTPAGWLDGDTPNQYFRRFDDPRVLAGMLADYCRQDVPVPDPLCDRLTELGQASAPYLTRLFLNAEMTDHCRATAGGLLAEIGGELPISDCIALLGDENISDELREQAIKMLNAAEGAAEAADTDLRGILLDVLLNCSRDQRLLDWILYGLRNRPADRMMYVSYLLRLGDERAIEPLTQMLTMTDIGYVEFMEIANVIESLGGDVHVQREFAGDADYEALRKAGIEDEPAELDFDAIRTLGREENLLNSEQTDVE